MTHTLRVLGYLRQDPGTRAFTLSGRMLEFGHTVLATDWLRDCAQPHLEALNRRVGETVNLMELQEHEIVYMLRYPSIHAVSVDLHVGSRLPAFCSAAGRAMLAAMDEARAMAGPRAAIYGGEAFLEFRRQLAGYEANRPERLAHPMFAAAEPVEMLIDEVEALWAPIAERDDWAPLYAKLEAIDAARHAWGL